MLRGILTKARPAVSAVSALAAAVAPTAAAVAGAPARFYSPSVVGHANYVPTIDELKVAVPPNEQYEMLRNKEAHIKKPSLMSQEDLAAATWTTELDAYLYKPVGFRFQTLKARGRLRLLDEFGVAQANGSRKSSRAYIHVKPGTGNHIVNGLPYSAYFDMTERRHAYEPLVMVGLSSQIDTFVQVSGGGHTGQAGAIRHALATALQNLDPALRPVMKPAHMLRRDPRNVERKKTGFAKARKRFAFVKR
jgi:ribosomal protein S9